MKKTLYLLLFCLIFTFFSVTVFADTPKFSFRLVPDTERHFQNLEAGDVIEGEAILDLYDDIEANFDLSFTSRTSNPLAREGSGSVLDMTQWIEFSEGKNLQIDGTPPGNQLVNVPYKITIPEGIVPGDYQAVLKARLFTGGFDDTTIEAGSGVIMSPAVGVKFAFSVDGDKTSKLDFLDLLGSFTENSINPKLLDVDLNVQYENLGNTLLKPVANIEVTDVLKNKVYLDKFDLFSVFPGKSDNSPIKFDLDSFIGWRDISVDLRYYPIDVKTGQQMGESFSAGSASLRIYVIPWMEILLFSLLLFVLASYLLIKYWKFRSLLSASKIYLVKEGDNLQSISTKFKASGEDIINVNKLKAPYFLEPGEKIFIPKK